MAYDDVGALGGLFAPAYISGDQQSMDAVARWNSAHLKTPPAADGGQPPVSGSFGVAGGGSNVSKSLQPGFDGGGRAIPEGFSLAPSLYTAGSAAITNGPTYSAPAAVTGGTQVNGGPDLGSRDAIASLLMGGDKSGLR